MAHTCKWTCTQIPFKAMHTARKIIAAIGETAPSEIDMRHPVIGKLCQKEFNPEYDAFDRLRATRFIEHMTQGSSWSAIALHGGGNPEASRVMAMKFTDWTHIKNMVKAATGIEKDSGARSQIIDDIGKRSGRISTILDLPHSS